MIRFKGMSVLPSVRLEETASTLNLEEISIAVYLNYLWSNQSRTHLNTSITYRAFVTNVLRFIFLRLNGLAMFLLSILWFDVKARKQIMLPE